MGLDKGMPAVHGMLFLRVFGYLESYLPLIAYISVNEARVLSGGFKAAKGGFKFYPKPMCYKTATVALL